MEGVGTKEQVQESYGFDNIEESVAEWFVSRGFPDLWEGYWFNAAEAAVFDGRRDVIDFLIKIDAFKPSERMFINAARTGNVQVLEFCKEYMNGRNGAQLNPVFEVALAAKEQTSIHWLIENGFNDECLSIHAIWKRDTNLIKYLHEQKAIFGSGTTWWAGLMTNRLQSSDEEQRNTAFDIVKFLIEKQVPFSKFDTIYIQEGRLEIPLSQWAKEQGLEVIWRD